jgi:hypothetical protein
MAPKDHRNDPGMDHPSHAPARPRGQPPSGGELAGLSIFLAAVVLLPLLAGIALDNLLHAGIFLFAGLLIGILAGIGVVYTRFRAYL